MRPLHELLNHEDSALPIVHEWAAAIPGHCEILPPAQNSGDTLFRTQVTTRSPMGAVIYHTGGILVEGGWLRILGSGHERLSRNLPDWNEGRGMGFYLIADDAVGGFFALNGGALGGKQGDVHYWAPDALEWQNLETGYSEFLAWALATPMKGFYEQLRWPGWEQDLTRLPGDCCFSFYPFLWAREGSVTKSRRAIIPIKQEFEAKRSTVRQIAGG